MVVLTLPRRVLGCLTLACIGCVPDAEPSDTLVNEPRILAVRAEPAEAAPREKVTLSALYAGAETELDPANLDWAFCLRRKSLAELGPVSPACLVQESSGLQRLGNGEQISGALPQDACRLFGPDRPPAMGDEPVGRAVDPDPSGGFYQPLRLYDAATARYATFEERVSCSLAGVTQTEFAAWNQRYRRNQNPSVAELTLALGGEDVTIGSETPYPVHAAERISLRVYWPDCTDGSACEDGICGFDETRLTCAADCAAANGCGGSEHYLYYDREGKKFVTRREAIRVSWFATGGSFRDARTGRTEPAADSGYSDNVWIAPKTSGEARLWVVLRDDRGGVGWQSYRFAVK